MTANAPFIHASAFADDGCAIGVGTRIWHGTHIMAGAVVGRDCNIGQNVFIAATARVGDRVKIQNNVSLYDGVILEDEVFIGPAAVFTNVRHPRAAINRRDRYQPTLVRRGATVGANATVLCGVTLFEYCFVGAGAVVTRDVPAHALVYGNPARRRGWACLCGYPLRNAANGALRCAECASEYSENASGLVRRE